MSNWSARGAVRQATLALTTITTLLATLLVSGLALASEGTGHKGGGEANLMLLQVKRDANRGGNFRR